MVSTTFLYNQLSKYGISSSGNIQSDLAELKKVKQSKGESTTDIDNFTNLIKQVGQDNKSQKNQGAMQGPPWDSLMKSLGLELQGSKEADFAAIESKITQLESSNLSADQKASLETLKAQFENMKKIEANHSQEQKTEKAGQKSQGQPAEPSWFSLLKTLGLQPQGSPEADFAAMQAKLTQMQSTNLSTDQKANLTALQAQLEQYKNSVN